MYLSTKDNTKLFYTIKGEGIPIVMIHGNNQSQSIFDTQSDFFSPFFCVIRMDSRAHGKSERGTQKLTLDLLTSDLFQLINVLGLEDLIIIGYSDGANIALKLAVEYPVSLKGLVLISPNLHVDGLKPHFKKPLQLINRLTHLSRGFIRSNLWLEKLDLMTQNTGISLDVLKNVNIPVLILSGEYDIIHRHHLEEINNALPNAQLEIIKNHGHAIINSPNAELISRIYGFLSANFHHK